MFSRRSLIAMAAISALSGKVGFAHDRKPSHKHPHPQGSNQCIPGGEFSSRRGDLDKYFNMPRCQLIIHHANKDDNIFDERFERIELGWSVFGLWMREDSALMSLSSENFRSFLLGQDNRVLVEGQRPRLVLHGRTRNKEAFRAALKSLGTEFDAFAAGLRHLKNNGDAIYEVGYDGMRMRVLADSNVMAIGYRGGSYKGLRPVLLDGMHPV